jgi:hypothetical protein
MERRSVSQKVCGSRKCRSALDARTVEIRFMGKDTSVPDSGFNSPDISTPKTAIRPHRTQVVVGPELSSSQFHCATVPDGPGGRWEGGEYRRIEAKNKAVLEATEQAEIEANGHFTEPDWQEVVSPNDVRCWMTS